MFKRIIATGCTIKSQQRGEPELTEQELYDALDSILHSKPGAFLMRFGKYLVEDDLQYFNEKCKDDFEVEFRVKELQKNFKLSSKSRMQVVKNRRYKFLEHLMQESDYFSEEEMRERDPLLFEYYIGQFLSDEEKYATKENPTDMRLSSMILENMRVDRRTRLLEEQRRSETGRKSCVAGKRSESDQEEFDSSSEDEDDDEPEPTNEFKDLESFSAPMGLSSDPETVAREKAMLSQEFLAAMQASFLSGNDKDFDYSQVDHNECYDSLDMLEKDAQDEYFDSEEPSWCGAAVDAHSDSGDGMELGTTTVGESDCHMSGNEVGGTDHMTLEPSGKDITGMTQPMQ